MFASQTAMSMIPTLSILFIMFWSWLILDEKLGRYDIMAISFLIPGTIVVLLSSDVAETEIKSDAFNYYLFSNSSVMFLSMVMGIFILGGLVSMHILQSHQKMSNEIENRYDETNDTDEVEKNSSAATIISAPDILSYRWNLVPMVYLPWFAGLFCCLASTLVKSLFMIYKDCVKSGENLFYRFGEPDAIILTLHVGLLTFLSFYLLNKSLQYFEPIYILPFEKVSLLINTLL